MTTSVGAERAEFTTRETWREVQRKARRPAAHKRRPLAALRLSGVPRTRTPTRQLRVTSVDFQVPLRERFRRLATEWQAAVAHVSSISDMVTHPRYREIVALGVEAVPLILEDLRREPGFWIWALEEMTGENPVPAQDEGDLTAMARAWVEWGAARGHVQP